MSVRQLTFGLFVFVYAFLVGCATSTPHSNWWGRLYEGEIMSLDKIAIVYPIANIKSIYLVDPTSGRHVLIYDFDRTEWAKYNKLGEESARDQDYVLGHPSYFELLPGRYMFLQEKLYDGWCTNITRPRRTSRLVTAQECRQMGGSPDVNQSREMSGELLVEAAKYYWAWIGMRPILTEHGSFESASKIQRYEEIFNDRLDPERVYPFNTVKDFPQSGDSK